MNVRDLIERLEDLGDDELPVGFHDGSGGIAPLETVGLRAGLSLTPQDRKRFPDAATVVVLWD